MSTRTIGIIMNGVTGRMGGNQHLRNSIAAIRRDGGVMLKDGTRLMPEPILVGRNAERVAEAARSAGIEKWSTDLDGLLEHETDGWIPDVALVFGGRNPEMKRRFRLRERGAAIVFGLRNHGYYAQHAFAGVDLVIATSQFLSDAYRRKIGLASIGIPSPIIPDDVIADDQQPIFATAINPSVEKGLFLFATLAEELCKARPDLPIMVVERRGTAGLLV